MTTSVNPTLTTTEQIFKDLVWDPMIIAGENWLKVAVPLDAVPVVSEIIDSAITDETNNIFNSIILYVDVTFLKLKNAAAQSAYESASESLFVIYEEKGISSAEYQQARDAARVALGKLLSYTS